MYHIFVTYLPHLQVLINLQRHFLSLSLHLHFKIILQRSVHLFINTSKTCPYRVEFNQGTVSSQATTIRLSTANLTEIRARLFGYI